MKKFLFFTADRSEFFIQLNFFELFFKKKINFHILCSRAIFNEILSIENSKLKKHLIQNLSIIENKFINSNDYIKISKSLLKIIQKISFDISIVYGDRVEAFAYALICFSFRKSLIHLCGGDITKGSIDDKFRNMISSMSHYNITTNFQSYKRLKVFFNSSKTFNVGFFNPKYLIPDRKFLKKISIKDGEKYILITYHPNTIGKKKDVLFEIKQLILALNKFKDSYKLIFTYPNPDKYNEIIIDQITKFKNQNLKNVFFIKKFGKYFSYYLENAFLFLGNSSSGIYESPKFGTPFINIGNRQDGRAIRKNVINCKANRLSIVKAINKIINNYSKFSVKLKNNKNMNDKFINTINEILKDHEK